MSSYSPAFLFPRYDQQAFGTTATTEKPVEDPNMLHTDPGQKDHTILGQILNPGGNKSVLEYGW